IADGSNVAGAFTVLIPPRAGPGTRTQKSRQVIDPLGSDQAAPLPRIVDVAAERVDPSFNGRRDSAPRFNT
ncbi:MAG: hypothetical protein KDE61_00350, partial [Novosphingobium sp.]|nr:hypothetical protein [Novosphingobium sp.]